MIPKSNDRNITKHKMSCGTMVSHMALIKLKNKPLNFDFGTKIIELPNSIIHYGYGLYGN